MREPQVTFAMRELDRLKAIQAVVDGDLKPGRAAERLGLATRQVLRLVRRREVEGRLGLFSRHGNRPGSRGLTPALAGHVLAILREHWRRFWVDAGRREAQSATGLEVVGDLVRRHFAVRRVARLVNSTLETLGTICTPTDHTQLLRAGFQLTAHSEPTAPDRTD